MSTPIAILLDATGRRRATLLLEQGVVPGQEDLPKIRPDQLAGFLDPVNPIRVARLAAGLSQGELASALGVSQPMLSKLERKDRPASPKALARIQAAIRALEESQRIWESSGKATLEDLLAAQAPLAALALARKARDPQEWALLRAVGDPLVPFEREGRMKAGGARAQRPPRRGSQGPR